MLHWTLVFLVLAMVAAVFGLTGVAESAVLVAKILFVIFVALFIVSLLFGRRMSVE